MTRAAVRCNLQLSLFPSLTAGAAPGVAAPGTLPALAGFPRGIPAGGVELVASILGRAVLCRVRRSPRARGLRLLVERSAALTVVLPLRFPLAELSSALEENARWILRTLERHRPSPGAPRPRLEDGGEVSLLGAPHTVRVLLADGLGERPRVWRRGAEIGVCVPPLHPKSPAEMLKTWLRATAAAEIPGRVLATNEALGFPLARINVRDQKTKWGACSARGNLSFNWRLVLAPVEVLDYVILHELCHLRELNHSHRFWKLLRSLRPEYESQRAWLRENEDLLDI